VTEDERQALLPIHATFPDLDRWRARSRKAEVPERGSEAAVWQWFPPGVRQFVADQAVTELRVVGMHAPGVDQVGVVPITLGHRVPHDRVDPGMRALRDTDDNAIQSRRADLRVSKC